MRTDNQLEAIQLIALYTIFVDMIHKGKIGIMETLAVLQRAGLTTNDYDTWYSEDGREIHFTIPFPTFKLQSTNKK